MNTFLAGHDFLLCSTLMIEGDGCIGMDPLCIVLDWSMGVAGMVFRVSIFGLEVDRFPSERAALHAVADIAADYVDLNVGV